ncbi:hypothetical protein [Brevundimonas sp.]|uniref:hypothetical protein n=1 Tax=Brevundimonas sp. TaxID=1871086 RepID=UPI0025DF0419|nr:hypothetical protein [Brevundimonas sp.]
MRQSLIVLTLLAGALALAACQPGATESEGEVGDASAEALPAPDTIPEEEPTPEEAVTGDDAIMEDPPMPADPDNPMGSTPPTLPEDPASRP